MLPEIWLFNIQKRFLNSQVTDIGCTPERALELFSTPPYWGQLWGPSSLLPNTDRWLFPTGKGRGGGGEGRRVKQTTHLYLEPILKIHGHIYTFTFSKFIDSSVGIALAYGLDDRGSRVRFPAGAGNFFFNTASRTALGPIQPPSHGCQWFFTWG
jgi:hypothetical protein